MSLTWPWLLATLLLVPALFALVWVLRRRRRTAAVRVTSIALVRSAIPARSPWRRRIPPALLALGLLVLALGAARPQLSVPVAADGTSIILAMDVSSSMCATDVDPNRLSVAQDAALDFVDSQPSGTRIGLVTFAGTAGLLVPPTDDVDQLEEAIEGFTVSRGTAIGSAILTSLDAIAEIDPSVAGTGVDLEADSETSYVPHVIVVLTDGASTQGVDPATAAEQAAARGVRVFTIGFGTTTPAASVCSSTQAGGNLLGGGGGGGGAGSPLVFDEESLTEVADATGGTYYQAENADELGDALDDLPSTFSLTREDRDVSAWFAGAGGLLVAAGLGLSLWFNRVRKDH